MTAISSSSLLVGEKGARREAVGRTGGSLLAFARQMGRAPTEAEGALWRLLRCKRLAGYKFKRQQRFEDRYIVDFVCFARRAIVEVDGSQHVGRHRDRQRDAWLRAQGYTILRFWNDDVLARPDAVLTSILSALDNGEAGNEPASPLTLSPAPPPQGGREKKDHSHG